MPGILGSGVPTLLANDCVRAQDGEAAGFTAMTAGCWDLQGGLALKCPKQNSQTWFCLRHLDTPGSWFKTSGKIVPTRETCGSDIIPKKL